MQQERALFYTRSALVARTRVAGPLALSMLCWFAWACGATRPEDAIHWSVPEDSSWSADFAQVGTDDNVTGGFAVGDSLFICGRFDHVGKEPITAVALFDGTTWHGFGAGLPDTVSCLALWNGQLIAGGSFTRARGAPADYLARWNGAEWESLPNELNNRVDALCEWNGMLVAGGAFGASTDSTLNNIGAWDGTAWHPFGTGMGWTNNREEVYTLIVWQGKLVAGGRISSAGGVPIYNVAQWDGSAWSSVSTGTNGDVWAFGLLENGARLVMAGAFNFAGGNAVGVSSWDGATWNLYNGGANSGVEGMAVYRGKIVVTGPFDKVGGVKANHAAQWDGTTWRAMSGGITSNPWEIRSPRVFPAVIPYGSLCVIGGFLQGAGSIISPNLVAWNDTTWLTMGDGQGTDFDVRALYPYEDHLIAGGYFITAGSRKALQVGSFDGTTWLSLANGVNGAPVSTFTEFGNALITGGNFTKASGVTVNNIARWNGSAWSALGTGTNGSVFALTVYNGQLIAGGTFTTAGGTSATYIAAWNGTSWSALGGGVNNTVSTLGVWNGQLVVGGRFTQAGGVSASCIATWDGTQWHALGAGLAGSNNSQTPGPHALAQAVFHDQLVIGGNFTSAGGVSANYIAAWDGTQWTALGAGVNGQFSQAGPEVDALLASGDSLYVGGIFTEAGGAFAGYIATWDGTQWATLGSGLHMKFPTGGGAFALAMYQGSLYVGGDMDTAGGKLSAYIARWDPPAPQSTAVHDAPPRPRALLVLDGPAPSRTHTSLTFMLASTSPVRIDVFDSTGRSIATLVAPHVQHAGTYHAEWDGMTRDGIPASTGVYYARLVAGGHTESVTIVRD